MTPNPSPERDCHRQGTWPARPSFLSSASRAKRLSGVSPSAQTLGLTSNAELSRARLSVVTPSLSQPHAGAPRRRASAKRWRSFGRRRLPTRCTAPSARSRAFALRHGENTRREPTPPLVHMQPEEGSSLVVALRVHGVALVRHARFCRWLLVPSHLARHVSSALGPSSQRQAAASGCALPSPPGEA